MKVSVGVQAWLLTEVGHGLIVKDRDPLHNMGLVGTCCNIPLGGTVGGQVNSTEVQSGVGPHREGQGRVNAPGRRQRGENGEKEDQSTREHGCQRFNSCLALGVK